MKRLHRAALASAALAVAFAPYCWAQDPPTGDSQAQTITFKAPAERISVLLADLSKQAGVQLTAEPATGNEVMLLQVKDVTLSELMKRIADAAGAKWITQTSGYRLSRPSELSRAQTKAEVAIRAAALKRALEPYVQSLDSSSTPSGVTLGSNAITRLIQAMGIDEIAALAFDIRSVYSTNPNRTQVALGNGAGQIVAQYVEDARAAQSSTDTQTPAAPGRRGRVGAILPGGNLDLTPAKADLIVSHMGFSEGLNLQLLVGDAEGRLVSRAQMSLVPAPPPRDVAEVSLDSAGDRLELSDLAAQYAKLLTAPSSGPAGGTQNVVFVALAAGDAPGQAMVLESDFGKTPDVDKDMRTRIVNPETNEPLAMCAGEALGKAADAAGLNIAAVIPDSALVPAAKTVLAGITPAGVVAAAQSDWGMQAAKDNGWLVFHPRKQASSYNYRLDRPVLGKALRQLASAGLLTLDDRATYAAGEPIAPQGGNFESEVFRLINAQEARRLASGIMTGERKMLRFFAGLTMFQRQALGSGKSLTIGSLGFQLNDILADMVFNSMDGPTVGGAGGGPGGGRRTPPQRMGMTGEMATERTEVLPDGIPSEGILTVQTTERPAVFGIGPNGEKVAVGGGPSLIFAVAGDQAQPAPSAQYALYMVGDRSTYTFNFQLLPNVVFRRTLTDTSVDASAKAVPYDQLPDDARKLAEQWRNATIRLNIVQSQDSGPVRP